MKIRQLGFIKLKLSKRIVRRIVLITGCIVALAILLPSLLVLYSHIKKSQELFLPKIIKVRVNKDENAKSVCFIFIKNIDPVKLRADISYTLLLRTPRQILGSGLVDISNLNIIVDFTPSYFEILEDFTHDPQSIYSIPLTDFFDPYGSYRNSSEYYMKSKKYNISLPIIGYLSKYPIDSYVLFPAVDIRLENHKNRKEVRTDLVIEDIGSILVSSDALIEATGFEILKANTKDKKEVIGIIREKLVRLHVEATLIIEFILVLYFCLISLKDIKNPIFSIWESVIGGSVVMFSILSSRPILVPSYINTITFVDTFLALFMSIIVSMLVFRIYLTLSIGKSKNNSDSHV